MPLQEEIVAGWHLVPLPFQVSNVPDAAGTAKAVQADSNDYVMNWPGSIVGISNRHNADLTGGVITMNPTIDGTANTTLAAVTDDTNQQHYASKAPGRINFAAGARIGAAWTETGTVAPTTTDCAIIVWVLVKVPLSD